MKTEAIIKLADMVQKNEEDVAKNTLSRNDP